MICFIFLTIQGTSKFNLDLYWQNYSLFYMKLWLSFLIFFKLYQRCTTQVSVDFFEVYYPNAQHLKSHNVDTTIRPAILYSSY